MSRSSRYRLPLVLTALTIGASHFSPVAGVAHATQQQYTEQPAGANSVALGYPVPLPIDSLTPVAGFRSYASLHARHQQLAIDSDNAVGEIIGETQQQRPIWAYVLSDSDAATSEGFIREAGVLQNGGIHAREWQSPEVLTGIFETLINNETDAGLHQYLLENTRIVLIPVLNIDGFLQTQRYPDRFMRSTYAGDPSNWPRDGRMRRKNMRNVDDDLASESDNLFGIDLNRNNAPWWASSNRSSGNPGSLVYHGSSPASEPETQALQQALMLLDGEPVRLYIDTHSFSKLYYLSRNGNARRDTLALTLGQQMAAATGNSYNVSPDPINSGIGSTDEYFTYEHQALSYTLEIEPRDSSAEYGGFGVSHDGFILPANQIERVRTELTRAALLGYYKQAGAPTLIQAQVRDTETDSVLASLNWAAQSSSTRTKTSSDSRAWQSGASYRLVLDFNKPMRVRNEQGDIINYRGQSVTLAPRLRLLAQQSDGSLLVADLDSSSAGWCQGASCRRYDSDRFETTFNWPAGWDAGSLVNVRLQVAVSDFAGNGLDANPATVMHWQDGAWRDYEDEFAVSGDSGGADQQLLLIRSGEPPVYNGGISVPTLRAGQAFDYQFASNAFTDPEGGALTYELRSDPSPLPSWLQFDAANRRLSGTPPNAGSVSAQIVARDADGNIAVAPLTLTITAADSGGGSGGGAAGFGAVMLLSLALARLQLLRSQRQRK
ncbi:MAG: M14 family zinc carboxypeptidase [Permianibacter sp.]